MPKTILINGIIGREVKASHIAEQIESANGDDITLEVNSVGGFVYEGFQIFNAIKKTKSNVTVEITGVCASIASYLVLAADKIITEKNAMFMIHNAFSMAIGDHKKLRKISNSLEHNSGIIAEQYVKKTGKPLNEILTMMDKETFIYGDDIVAQGFADSSFEGDEIEAKGFEASLESARMKIEYCSSEMLADELASKDFEKAAAYLEGINQHLSGVKQIAKPDKVDNKSNPPENKQTNQTGVKMNLAQFLAQNPEAKTQYDIDLKAQNEAGQAKQKATFEAVAPYLASDSAYGGPVRDLALKALSGEMSSESVLSTVAVIDILNVQNNSKNADADSDLNPDNPP